MTDVMIAYLSDIKVALEKASAHLVTGRANIQCGLPQDQTVAKETVARLEQDRILSVNVKGRGGEGGRQKEHSGGPRPGHRPHSNSDRTH